ncbi:phosphotriesterase [Frigoribacterium sp. PhB24]|uniref:phosphotriesterase family protein n=1 Tax=Frigoribacterium sp. PhB24 TaxID=2485204 RepID=UPI000F4878E0|nr:aryldialkylphosphatase [Frigoribacterium sp. PhB24]ROS48854.1 phosphotriesterase-related protein [Frigoribacterium sp. PhB24]
MIGEVRTVLGDVPASSLGPLDYHEHLFQVSPLLPGDELDDEALSSEEAVSLVSGGIRSMVEATPVGLGANPEAVARISARTGLQVVHATGAHHRGHYRDSDPLLIASEADLVERFVGDVVDGLRGPSGARAIGPDGAPVRAGLVKGAARYWSIDAFGERVLSACAATAGQTGVPVMVHLDHGSAAHEVLDRLAASGLPADRVVLAHVDRNLDAGLHASLVERGAWLGYDGAARHREAPDSALIDCLRRTVEAVGDERILLGGDVARASRYRAYGGMPGLDYLAVRFMPRLERELGAEFLRALTVRNPAVFLALST